MASRAEILGFIASSEPLEKTLARYPDWSREKLRALLRDAAVLFAAEDRGASADVDEAPPPTPVSSPAPAPSSPPRTESPPRATRAQRETVAPAPTRDAPAAVEPPAPEPVADEEPGAEAAEPVARRLRLYSDGAARGNPGPAGAGAVLTKMDGTVVAKLGKFLGNQTNNFAEYHGLLLGLETALRIGANEIEVFADSELLIRQLQGSYKVKSPTLRPLFEQARAQLARFRKVRLQHVPREQNKAADEMSNRAIDERM